MTDIANGDGGLNATYTENHNLCRARYRCGAREPGTGDLRGVPVFAGGSAPSRFSGFALCANSPGVGRASDGTNVGLQLSAVICGSGRSARPGGANRRVDELVSVKLAAHTIRRGAPVRFAIRLRGRAKVRITFLRWVDRRAGGRRHFEKVGTVVFTGTAGLKRWRVVKLGEHTLTAGRYEAELVAGGRAHRVNFTVTM
jgi:hypothetical protein